MSRKQSWRDRKIFWKEWGVYLVVAGVLLLGMLLFRVFFSTPTELIPAEHYRVYFTHSGPQGYPSAAALRADLLSDIAAAQERVDVATPGLDLDDLAAALIEAHVRGVTVRVLEDAAAQERPEVAAVTARLEGAGIPVVLRPEGGSLAGAFVIVDRVVWAGPWDLSRRGLEQDVHAVLRFDLVQEAENFAAEFTELFEEQSFGPVSFGNTPHPFISIFEKGTISTYFTPEDDPLGEVLRTVAAVQGELLVASEGLNDSRLADRLAGESLADTVIGLGLFEAQGFSSGNLLQQLREFEMSVRLYGGGGRLRENVIVVDAQTAILFSQPLVQEGLEQNDGYVLIVRDEEVAKAFHSQVLNLFSQGQEWP